MSVPGSPVHCVDCCGLVLGWCMQTGRGSWWWFRAGSWLALVRPYGAQGPHIKRARALQYKEMKRSAAAAGAVGVPDATADPDRPRRVVHSLLYIYSVSTERKPTKTVSTERKPTENSKAAKRRHRIRMQSQGRRQPWFFNCLDLSEAEMGEVCPDPKVGLGRW